MYIMMPGLSVMNYQLTLPRNWDMDALRARIPQIGQRFDGLPGLGIKAFLFRRQGEHGSPVNQYAPFYLWTDPDAAAQFLWGGGGFDGVVDAYGRPAVQTWTATAFVFGPAASGTPNWAVRHVERIRDHVSLESLVSESSAKLVEESQRPGIHSSTFGIDPRTWESVTFTLTTGRPDAQAHEELYEVPYLSTSDVSRSRLSQLSSEISSQG
jgi:hypothetical protein